MEEYVKELLDSQLVPSPIVESHIRETSKQKGEMGSWEIGIGRRGTPYVSFWDMRPKWDKWGNAWEAIGTDGDMCQYDDRFVIPAIIRLVYFKTNRSDNKVCQLAYVIKPEILFPPGVMPSRENDKDCMEYEAARSFMPRRIV